jgi:hypothetical protein
LAAANDTTNDELEMALIKDIAFVLVLVSMSASSAIFCNALSTTSKLSVKRNIASCRCMNLVSQNVRRFTSSLSRRFGESLKKLMTSDYVVNMFLIGGCCEL